MLKERETSPVLHSAQRDGGNIEHPTLNIEFEDEDEEDGRSPRKRLPSPSDFAGQVAPDAVFMDKKRIRG